MKFKKLLVVSAMALMGTTAYAEVPDGIWTMPEPQGLEFTTFTDDATHYYLYNPGAKMFFASGNSWNTQASARVYGYAFWLEPATEEGAPDGTYELWNYVDNPQRTDVTGNHNVFFDGGSFWVDHGTQAGYTFNYVINGDFVRFEAVTKPGYYIGWDGTYIDSDDAGATCSSVLKNLDPATEGVCVDWKAVTEESYEAFVYGDDYQAYCDGVKLYIASIGLKKALEDAEAAGLNCAATIAVYSNTASTIEDLRAGKDLTNARIALKKAVDAAKALFIDVAAAEAVLADESTAIADVNKAETSLKDITAAKQKLKNLIDDCKSKGYTETAAAEAVLQNTAATKAEVEKAESDLAAAYAEWGKSHASVEKPADMSSKIVNPNFDNASSSGWSGSTPNMVGSGAHGPANVAETWNATFDMYQDIEGLPAGVYALGAQTMWRCNYADMVNGIAPAAKLYAVVGENETQVPFNYAFAPLVTEAPDGSNTSWGVGAGFTTTTDDETGNVYYIPNDPSGFRLFAELGYYDTKLLFGVSEGEKVRIGVKNPAMKGTWDNWSCYDTFTLTYYGTGADAAKLYLDETIKNYSEKTIEEGTIYTKSYLDAYNEALKKEISVNSFEEVATALGGIDAANKAIEKNIQLWQDWQDLVDQVKVKYVVDDQYAGIEPEIDDLADYVDDVTVGDILDAAEWTNEELEAEMAQVKEWVNSLVEKSKLDVWDGKNMTSYITNPTFETSTTKNTGTSQGWTVDRIDGGNVTPGPINGDGDTFLEKCGYYNGCFESWHCHKWDVWQEITGLPVGMYELEVQGYVRCEVDGYVKGDELGEDYPSPVYLYMNNAMSQFPSVYSQIPAENGITEFQIVENWTQEEINGNYFPNSMGGAAQCFHIDKEAGLDGMYKTTAYGLIAKEGDTFRIGVKMDADQNWWCIWDNFKLTYRKPTADIVKPVLEEALKTIDTNKAMGKNIFEQADAVKNSAAQALSGNDGDAMFAVLTQVYDLTGDIIASVEKFNKLSAINVDLENAAFDSQSAAAGEAKALINQINDGIANHTIDDAEVDALIEQIALMMTKLNLPDDMAQASDNDPKECTGVIRTPSFEDVDGLNSSAGWTNPGNLGNDDTQKGALAIEFWQTNFDMFQTIKGLPKGTYQLTVDAWCRVGDNQQNYDAWTADNAATMAFLYAVDGDSTVYSAPIANVMKGAMTDSYGYDGEAEFTVGDVTYYMPGSLVGGRGYMDDPNVGVYTNSVICKVGDDGVLTIGIKKDQNVTNSWVVCDDFKLYYLGDSSAKQPDGDPSSVNAVAVAPVKIEYFNLNGARINKQFKGIAIQKQTLKDGSVKVQKVTVK
jgi:hypothetical protein